MENPIPLPTDNLYKFCATFGLMIAIFCLGASLYNQRSINEIVFSSHIESATLNSIKDPTTIDMAKREALEKKLEIAEADHAFLRNAIAGIFAFSLLMMTYGFLKWYKEIQVIQDETSRLQLDKLRSEVQARQKEAITLRPNQSFNSDAASVIHFSHHHSGILVSSFRAASTTPVNSSR